MNVRELKALLDQCDPEAIVVAHLAFQTTEEITSLERLDLGGVGFRLPTSEIPVVRLSNGVVWYMKKQGMSALGVEDLPQGEDLPQ